MLLTTERLILRDFQTDDWPSVHEYASRPAASRYQAWGPNTRAETQAFVDAAAAAAREEPRFSYQLAVVQAPEQQLIGAVGLVIRSWRFRTAELSYIINPSYWAQGFATEAAKALVAFGFRSLALHRLEATCDPRNVGSERVLQRLGMIHEGRKREVMLIRDGWRDSQLYGLLEHEWHPEPARRAGPADGSGPDHP